MFIDDVVKNQKAFMANGQTRTYGFRRRQLLSLRQGLFTHEQALLSALRQDLGKNAVEAYTSELGLVHRELSYALDHLRRWMRPQKKHTPPMLFPGHSLVIPEPKGVVLIISPWNYPLGLTLTPLISALAAGNSVVVKPSEMAPQSGNRLKTMLADCLPNTVCHVQLGDAKTAETLLEQHWDHIFFTGSTHIGRLVMAAAARQLIPVTLELGGKNPCLLMDDAHLPSAALRIVWGKFLNAGQTCVAPDMVYVPAQFQNTLEQELIKAITRFYGPEPKASADYSRIINRQHLTRLRAYLQEGKILWGGQWDELDNYLAPTIMTNIHPDSRLLKEEIFGPILPIVPYHDLDQLLADLKSKPIPLALYLFTANPRLSRTVLESLPSGTAAINDTINQISTPYLPLGGQGASGMGQYHGRAGFDCFTHYRAVLVQRSNNKRRLMLPPYRIGVGWLKSIYAWLLK